MIQINLSDEQAERLLNAFGWRITGGGIACMVVPEEIAKEVFIQLENQVEAKGGKDDLLTPLPHRIRA